MSYVLVTDFKDSLLLDHLTIEANATYYLGKGDDYLNAFSEEKNAESIIEPLHYLVKELLICKIYTMISSDRLGGNKGTITLEQGNNSIDSYKVKFDHYSTCVKELEQKITKNMLDGITVDSPEDSYISPGFEYYRA